MKAKSDIYQLKSPLTEDSHTVWLASNLSVTRNLSKFKFPPKLDGERKQQVISLLKEGLTKSSGLSGLNFYSSESIGPLEKEFLSEHFLASDHFHQAHGGEMFVTEEKGNFLAVFNLDNHLQLILTDPNQEIEKAWNRLTTIEHDISKSVDFAYSGRFGFLNADPKRAGTGLVITLFLHVPAIIHSGELPELIEKEREDEIEATGLQGNPNEMIGDILIARNICTLGLTEEYILTSLRMWATRAVVAEVSLRKKLKGAKDTPIKNKVARAFGLLSHSYQLETVEALNALSLVKLGVELGWVSCPPGVNLYQIFFNCRRAHLLNLLEETVDIPELPRKRAEYLQGIASKLSLVI